MARRRPWYLRALRVLAGIVVMAAVVTLVGHQLWIRAAGWGVPYASFTDEHGSSCVNTWSGHRCEPVTAAAVAARAEIDLPSGVVVSSGSEVQSRKWSLDAVLVVPQRSVKAYRAVAASRFGDCSELRGSELSGEIETGCVRVGTGAREDGHPVPTDWVVSEGNALAGEKKSGDLTVRIRVWAA